MIPAKQKVQIGKTPRQKAKEQGAAAAAISIAEREALELFPDPLPEPPRVTNCAICDKKKPRAHPNHPICKACAGDPDEARRRLAVERATIVNHQRACAREARAALDALDDAERERWGRFVGLRDAKDMKTATPEDLALYERTRRAYDSDDPRISAALRRMRACHEALWIANEADKHGCRKVDLRLAQLNLYLEEVAR